VWSPEYVDCHSKIDAWGALVKASSGKNSLRLIHRLMKKAQLQGITNISLSEARRNLKKEFQ